MANEVSSQKVPESGEPNTNTKGVPVEKIPEVASAPSVGVLRSKARASWPILFVAAFISSAALPICRPTLAKTLNPVTGSYSSFEVSAFGVFESVADTKPSCHVISPGSACNFSLAIS